MSKIAFELPEDSLIALKLDEAQAADELRLIAAVKLFELGRLSSGAAARVAGIPRVAFLAKLAELGVATFRETVDDLRSDLERA